MSDIYAIAQARRYYLHVANGGTLKARDVGLMVEAMEHMEAKLAKAVEGIKQARCFYQVTHIHAGLDATLAELTGGKDEG